MQCDNSEKSFEEWPTLGVVNNRNTTDGRGVVQADGIESNGNGAKNDVKSERPSLSNSKRKKNSSRRSNWSNLPINLPPYRNYRGSGRRIDDSVRPVENNRFHQNGHNHHHNGFENGRARGRGHRGYHRGRGSSNYRPPREPIAAPEEVKQPESTAEAAGHYIGGMMFFQPVYGQNFTSKEHLKEKVKFQIEYYLSETNLIQDIYVRRKMDACGYIPISLLATFRRMQQITDDLDLIIDSVKASDKLEVLNDTLVRPKIEPLRWPLNDCNAMIENMHPVYPSVVSCIPDEESREVVLKMNSLNLNGSAYSSMSETVPHIPAIPFLYTPLPSLMNSNSDNSSTFCPIQATPNVSSMPFSFHPQSSALDNGNDNGSIYPPMSQAVKSVILNVPTPCNSMDSVNGFGSVGDSSNCLEQDSNDLSQCVEDAAAVKLTTSSIEIVDDLSMVVSPPDSLEYNLNNLSDSSEDEATIEQPVSSGKSVNGFNMVGASSNSLEQSSDNHSRPIKDQAAGEVTASSIQRDTCCIRQYMDNAAIVPNVYSQDSCPSDERVNGFNYLDSNNCVYYQNGPQNNSCNRYTVSLPIL